MNANRRLQAQQESGRLSDVARLANALQRAGATRTEALKEAERLQASHGQGLTLAPTAPRP